jgi:hypothetical protein
MSLPLRQPPPRIQRHDVACPCFRLPVAGKPMPHVIGFGLFGLPRCFWDFSLRGRYIRYFRYIGRILGCLCSGCRRGAIPLCSSPHLTTRQYLTKRNFPFSRGGFVGFCHIVRWHYRFFYCPPEQVSASGSFQTLQMRIDGIDLSGASCAGLLNLGDPSRVL